MKKITTSKTTELFSSTPDLLGLKSPKFVIGTLLAIGAMVSVCVLTGLPATFLGVLTGLWLGNVMLYRDKWTQRLSLKSVLYHRIANRTPDGYDYLIMERVKYALKPLNTYKGLFSELRIPLNNRLLTDQDEAEKIELVIDKGHIYYEEFTTVSAVDMWDKALDSVFTEDEAKALPKHFSDGGYCKLQSFEEKLDKDWQIHKASKSNCMSERADLMLKRKDSALRDEIRFSCGCKDCTPSFLRCILCNGTSDQCNCLHSEKHKAMLSVKDNS